MKLAIPAMTMAVTNPTTISLVRIHASPIKRDARNPHLTLLLIIVALPSRTPVRAYRQRSDHTELAAWGSQTLTAPHSPVF
jgi:hypothetical protein